MKISLIWVVFLLIVACKDQSIKGFDETSLYDFSNPDVVWEMPSILNEISGITALNDSIMACINDEKGQVYFYHLVHNKIDTIISFTGKGDFEDIVMMDSTVYILESKGVIWKVVLNSEPVEITKYETALPSSLDMEGLTHDDQGIRLLIAAKNKIKNSDGQKVNVIYQFDLTTHTSTDIPLISWNTDITLTKDDFAPSALAIHPMTKDIYIISSVGKRLVVIDWNGQILQNISLDYKHFGQPEGIYFNTNGDLFLSNEKKKSKANILKFKINQPKQK